MRNTGTKIFEWIDGATRYRLVGVGKLTKGYEDSYVIEEETKDALGDSSWIRTGIETDEIPIKILITGIKAALLHR